MLRTFRVGVVVALALLAFFPTPANADDPSPTPSPRQPVTEAYRELLAIDASLHAAQARLSDRAADLASAREAVGAKKGPAQPSA